MIHDTFWLTANDRSQVFVNQWLPEGPLKAVILISHGMAEHSARYERLAQRLCNQTYGVYALDQRGHAALQLYTDEGYHALFSNRLAEQIANFYGITGRPATPQRITRLRRSAHKVHQFFDVAECTFGIAAGGLGFCSPAGGRMIETSPKLSG